MENRAYALLDVKSVDEDKRVLRGIATTPSVDRMGDVVEPDGAEFKLPIPFLWQHDSNQPIGHVTKAKVTKSGIDVEVRILKSDEPGTLKDRLDEAWQSIKLGLVRGLSIGFAGTEVARIDTGYRFLKWMWLELSAVTIAANGDCSIQTIKSIATEQMAASGRSDTEGAASGDKPKPVARRKTMAQKKTIAEQIADWEETRRQKSAEMDAIFDDAGEGETLDGAAQEAFDALEAEIGQIDAHIKRLQVRQKSAVLGAKEVKADSRDVSDAAPRAQVQVKAPELDPGIRFTRYVKCLGIAHKSHRDPVSIATEMFGDRDPKTVDSVKAAVIASNTTTDAALIGNEGGFADFVEFLRPRTILGRFGQNGVPALTRIPFRVPLITESAESTAYWVGEGKAKPLTKPAWTRTEMNPLKVANIAVATMEQLRDSSPSGEMLLRNSLANAIVKAQDQAFIDPTNAGTTGVKPAAVTNGLTAVASGGQDADAIREDARLAMQKFVTANNALTSGVWVMSAGTALSLSILQNPLGQPEFPGLNLNGGTFFGLPVVTSQYVGDYVALVNAEDIYFADEGGVQVDMSTEASLEMMDNPTGDSIAATPVAASLVSLWQTNSVAFRAERTVNWMRRRASAVALITGVTWGVGAS